jgi:precorrin-6B methylase 2
MATFPGQGHTLSNQANLELRRKIMGYIVAQAIHAVTAAGVVDALEGGPRPVADLAASTGTDADALRRFLRVLVAEGLFAEEPAGTFALTEMGALLRSGTPGSLRHFSNLMVGEAYQVWELAGHSLRTGEAAFAQRFGKPLFDWLPDHPDKAAEFDAAQAGLVELRLLPLLDRDWAGVSTVTDVGGGNGSLLVRLLARHPHLSGTLLDQAHAVDKARVNVARAGVADRCRLVPGDFFAAVPEGADVYVLAQILHDWDDDRAGQILARCRAAMPPHARLLVLEQAIAEDGQPHPAKLLDLHMLVLLGGRERTETEWRALLGDAGFTVTDISHHARASLIEARPG